MDASVTTGSIQGPAFAAYSAREDLRDYDPNALLLYVAELRLGVEDIAVFAANALTDGNNDKKCDLVAVVADGRRIVVAQGYETDMQKQSAPANECDNPIWPHCDVLIWPHPRHG